MEEPGGCVMSEPMGDVYDIHQSTRYLHRGGTMTRSDVNRLFRALLDHNVRFLVAGGLAVVAHGHVRLTADIDLLVDLTTDNVAAFADAIAECGYVPRAPVNVADLAVEATRSRWIAEKNMAALSFWSN